MNQYDLALRKSIDSANTDLSNGMSKIVYLAMFDLRAKSPSEFFRTINGKPLACSLLEFYAKSQRDMTLLSGFYEQDDRRQSTANLKLSVSFTESVNNS